MKKLIALSILWISLFPSASVYAQALQPAAQQYYFGFGPGFFGNMNSGSLATTITPGVMWSLAPEFDLGVFTDIAFSLHDNDARFISPQLKGRYIFTEAENIGYYVGFGLGYGYAHSQGSPGHPDDSMSGFASSLAFGLKAFRTSSVQLSVELENQFIWDKGNNGTPNMTFLKVGVHFY